MNKQTKLASPFRYPGGKTRLVRQILPHLESYGNGATTYIEPFVGGGSTLLAMGERFPDMRFIVNDGDRAVADFWLCMRSYAASQALAARVRNTVPTVDLFQDCKTRLEANPNPFEKAYAFIVVNRCAFSGIATSGPMGGYGQTRSSIACRWNAGDIAERIERLHRALGDRLEVYSEDCIGFIKRFFDRTDVLLYADPPYIVKGNHLYRPQNTFWMHYQLARTLRRAPYPWVCSYDLCWQVKGLYRDAQAILKVDARYSVSKTKRPRTREALIIGGGAWHNRAGGIQQVGNAPIKLSNSMN